MERTIRKDTLFIGSAVKPIELEPDLTKRVQRYCLTKYGMEPSRIDFEFAYASINGWYVHAFTCVDEDWNYYSKGYHQQFGPKKTVTGRYVSFIRVIKNGKIETRTVEVDSWRGQWLLNACIEAKIVKPQKAKGLRKIQLHDALTVKLHRTIGKIKIYARKIGMTTWDYCAVLNGTTYHAVTPKAALRGLKTKIKTEIESKNRPIDWDLCLKLNFCDDGIRSFANDFGLDLKARYSASELWEIVSKDLSKAAPYEEELRKLAKAVNFEVPQAC